MATFKRTDEHYLAGSLTLPQAYYTVEQVFARERDRLFRADWACAGHASRISNPGDYFLLNAFNESLIVVRDRQGGIRAFYNVCRHRGTRICETGEGRFSGSIQCSYHAWTYGLDGKLIGAPFMKDVPGFDWEENHLKAAPVHLWEGFIFVHLGQGRRLPSRRRTRRCWDDSRPGISTGCGRTRASPTRSSPTGSTSSRTSTSAITARRSIRS